MTDEEIIYNYNNYGKKLVYLKKYKEYLLNRYDDSTCSSESLYRIIHNLHQRPTCPVCGNKLYYRGILDGFSQYCSQKCFISIDKNKQKCNYDKEKYKKSCLEKYGVEYFFQSNEFKEKVKENSLIKYGIENPTQTKESIEKRKNTNLIKYGNENHLKSKEIREKIEKTNLEKYGNKYYVGTELHKKKYKQSCLNKYGVPNTFLLKSIQEKRKQTLIKNYGVDNPMKVSLIHAKAFETMKNNKTIGHKISPKEQYIADELKKKYPKLIQQYYSDLYPYECDIYIPEIDTYIEYNGFWSHGQHPFNENNINDINKANKWKLINTKYYLNAYKTWVEKDPLKRQTAKDNNLNYIEIWPTDNIDEIINNL